MSECQNLANTCLDFALHVDFFYRLIVIRMQPCKWNSCKNEAKSRSRMSFAKLKPTKFGDLGGSAEPIVKQSKRLADSTRERRG